MKFSFCSLQTDLVLLLLFSRYKGVENGSITQNFFILILMGIFLLRFFMKVSDASHWQTLSHNVVSSIPSPWVGYKLTRLVVIVTDCIGVVNIYIVHCLFPFLLTSSKPFGLFNRSNTIFHLFYGFILSISFKT
jgi:hypothetical protein